MMTPWSWTLHSTSLPKIFLPHPKYYKSKIQLKFTPEPHSLSPHFYSSILVPHSIHAGMGPPLFHFYSQLLLLLKHFSRLLKFVITSSLFLLSMYITYSVIHYVYYTFYVYFFFFAKFLSYVFKIVETEEVLPTTHAHTKHHSVVHSNSLH